LPKLPSRWSRPQRKSFLRATSHQPLTGGASATESRLDRDPIVREYRSIPVSSIGFGNDSLPHAQGIESHVVKTGVWSDVKNGVKTAAKAVATGAKRAGTGVATGVKYAAKVLAKTPPVQGVKNAWRAVKCFAGNKQRC
jgi:hypothetical protein